MDMVHPNSDSDTTLPATEPINTVYSSAVRSNDLRAAEISSTS